MGSNTAVAVPLVRSPCHAPDLLYYYAVLERNQYNQQVID